MAKQNGMWLFCIPRSGNRLNDIFQHYSSCATLGRTKALVVHLPRKFIVILHEKKNVEFLIVITFIRNEQR